MADSFDWTRFVTRVTVNALADDLYRMWATRAGIEEWFLRMSEFKNPDGALRGDNEFTAAGDTYRWRWFGWDDNTTEEGEIMEANGKDLFKFSFGKAGNCTVHIKQEEGIHIVELVQDQIPDTDEGKHYWHLGCKTGWTFYLANLKSICEGGIDLRNKNENIRQLINS